MTTSATQRSPRAPSVDLENALTKALAIYGKEGKHTIPADIAAKHMGYKDSNNGAALRALASLKSFGLIDRPKNGLVTVKKEVEDYSFTPDQAHRQQLLYSWLRNPRIYQELLERFGDRLPSDETLRYELIQKGFNPNAAEECRDTFKASVTFAGFYTRSPTAGDSASASVESSPAAEVPEAISTRSAIPTGSAGVGTFAPAANVRTDVDRIPVRLKNGRRAWLELPMPFYEADRELIKAHLALVPVDEEEAKE